MKILLDSCYNAKTRLYTFELIDDPAYKPTVNHPLWLIAQHQHKYLLGHRIIRKLLRLKMNKAPRWLFWADMAFYLGFLFMLTLFHVNLSSQNSLYSFNVSQSTGEPNFQIWPMPVKFHISEKTRHGFVFLFLLYYLSISTIIISKGVYQIYNFGALAHFGSIESWLELACLLFNFLAVLPHLDGSSAFGSLSCLFGWMSFAFFFQSVTIFKLGSYSVALRKTIQNSFKFLPFFCMIYFGFLCSFKIREAFGETYINNTVAVAIKTINMMIGELDGDEVAMIESNDVNYMINNIIYIFFIFIMCIIVLDLFIGLEVGEIKTVIDEAETYNSAKNMLFTLKVNFIPLNCQRKVSLCLIQ